MIRSIHDVRSDSRNPAANVRMGLPDVDWSRDELDARAVWENSQIKPRQRHAPHYWFLGRVLMVVGEVFDSAHWISWRAEHSINRTRCERAQLLARAFGSADEVADLPVLAAVALACERLGHKPRQTAAGARLRRSLRSIDKTLQERLDEFDAVTSTDGLRQSIAEIRQKLTAIEHACIAREKAQQSAIPKRRDKRQKSKVKSPKSKVQSQKSKVQSRKSKVESPKSKVQSRKSKVESL